MNTGNCELIEPNEQLYTLNTDGENTSYLGFL